MKRELYVICCIFPFFGLRYIKRGSDELGDVANFVETEQIVQKLDSSCLSSTSSANGVPLPVSSFVQVPE